VIIDMCKFKSSPNDESRAQSADSWQALVLSTVVTLTDKLLKAESAEK